MNDPNKGWLKSWNKIPEKYPELGKRVYALIDSSGSDFEPVVEIIYYLGKDKDGVDIWSLKNKIDSDSYIPQFFNILLWKEI